jgi:hypothetical protein
MAYNNFGKSVYGTQWQTGLNGANITVVDKVPQEMLFLVDNHWFQFPPSED